MLQFNSVLEGEQWHDYICLWIYACTAILLFAQNYVSSIIGFIREQVMWLFVWYFVLFVFTDKTKVTESESKASEVTTEDITVTTR